MTQLLFQTDSYLQQFTATVLAVNPDERSIRLDRTAFYPGGGGQPYDTGVCQFESNLYPVLRARKGEGGVWHTLGGEAVLPPVGASVQGTLDWARRYALMRTHTAMHILCGVVFRDYGAQVTGGDMQPLQGRMDFEFETLSRELVVIIEAATNREIQAARPVQVQILPREQAFQIPDLIRTKINLLPPEIETVRTIELTGLDLQADGGTHVRNTQEVGYMRITDYKSKGKVNKRIYVTVEDHA